MRTHLNDPRTPSEPGSNRHRTILEPSSNLRFRTPHSSSGSLSQSVPQLPGKASEHQVVRLAQPPRQLRRAQDIEFLQGHPVRPGEIRRRDDAFALSEQCEIFGRAFEGYSIRTCAFQPDDSEHLAADFESQIVNPLDLLGRMGHLQAYGTDAVGSHVISYLMSRIYGLAACCDIFSSGASTPTGRFSASAGAGVGGR